MIGQTEAQSSFKEVSELFGKALVTGGAGFVGHHLVNKLLARNESVRILVRATTNTQFLDGLRVEVVTGDLRDPASLEAAVEGCQTVFHCAADYRLWTPRPSVLYTSNVDGTRALFEACGRAGVEKIVYTSSVATIGLPADGSPGNEQSPVSENDMVGDYKRSKFLAERVAFEMAAKGLPIVIVNPSTPIGPGDAKPTPTGRIITDFLNGKMPAYVDTGLNLVAVEDVAEGHLLVAEKGRPGEPDILGGENFSLREILQALGSITGLKAPRIELPSWVAMVVAWVDTVLEGGLLGREPRVPIEGVKMARKKMYFDSQRAQDELGYQPTCPIQALERAVAWFVDHGYAPAPV